MVKYAKYIKNNNQKRTSGYRNSLHKIILDWQIYFDDTINRSI